MPPIVSVPGAHRAISNAPADRDPAVPVSAVPMSAASDITVAPAHATLPEQTNVPAPRRGVSSPRGSSAALGGRVDRPQQGAGRQDALVPVGPGRPGRAIRRGFPGFVSNPLPFQPAKVHSPPARRDILTRERLNAWLDKAVAGRVVLVVAEAGSGKTTLLADWARHTLRRTTWYRLESDDRDWLTFVRHLVAGGRELEADFGVATLDLLQRLGPGGPTQHEIFTSIARDLAESGATGEHGLTLIIDDAHIVDDCAEVQVIIGMLLERTGPGFSVIISSRAEPPLPMGKVRARGGVDGLTGGDLCFDPGETERLFRVAYRKPLDADVLTDLHARTEGWAALLTLVRAGLTDHDGTDAHALVASLSSAQGDLYEFLAEEVMAGLDAGLQHFLSRVAILMAVTPEASGLVLDAAPDDLEGHLREAERLGLLTRPDRGSAHRFHPLVREFLLARLAEEVGPDEVRQLHLKVAAALEPTDWLGSAWHYSMCGEQRDVDRVLQMALPTILATGRADRTSAFLDRSDGSSADPWVKVLRSRLELERGSIERAIRLARAAVQESSGTNMAGVTNLNLSAVLARHGFDEQAASHAKIALSEGLDETGRGVAEALLALRDVQERGDLEAAIELLTTLAHEQDRAGRARYAAITRVNLAVLYLWSGRDTEARRVATVAESALSGIESPELVAAMSAKFAARVHLGDASALGEMEHVLATVTSSAARDEAAIEASRLLVGYGSPTKAALASQLISEPAMNSGYRGAWEVVEGTICLSRGDIAGARSHAERASLEGVLDAAGRCRVLLLQARVETAESPEAGARAAARLVDLARAQHSALLQTAGALLAGLATPSSASQAVLRLPRDYRHLLTLLAEETTGRLGEMSPEALEVILDEARRWPERWRPVLRAGSLSEIRAAELLSEVGSPEDAASLRAGASTRKWLRPVAAAMTRRLAPKVHIQDLGPVRVSLGDQPLDKAMRRKVLALLCFASSRAGMAVARDEALEAIWPDLGVDTAVNSLHQTIYYLRRVFEPDYREGLSAGYVQYDGELLSLEENLVTTGSRVCWSLLAKARAGDKGAIDALIEHYTGTYALDFAYEDWASTYRDHLHAAVLAALETAIKGCRSAGETPRAIFLAQSILAIDPRADAIELELLRAYKGGGRQAAAAEQYAHYATFVRGELGVEPIPFDDV